MSFKVIIYIRAMTDAFGELNVRDLIRRFIHLCVHSLDAHNCVASHSFRCRDF